MEHFLAFFCKISSLFKRKTRAKGLSVIWKQHFCPVFFNPAFMFLPIFTFFTSFLRNKLIFSGFLAFLPASSRWRRTAFELMWAPEASNQCLFHQKALIKSFCKSKLFFLAYFLQLAIDVWMQSQCSENVAVRLHFLGLISAIKKKHRISNMYDSQLDTTGRTGITL